MDREKNINKNDGGFISIHMTHVEFRFVTEDTARINDKDLDIFKI